MWFRSDFGNVPRLLAQFFISYVIKQLQSLVEAWEYGRSSNMQVSLSQQRVCHVCTSILFKNGLCAAPKISRLGPGADVTRARFQWKRNFFSTSPLRYADGSLQGRQGAISRTTQQLEAIVLHARRTFGDRLPTDFLSSEEYQIYERLYGSPTGETRPEEIPSLQWLARNDGEEENPELLAREEFIMDPAMPDNEPFENDIYGEGIINAGQDGAESVPAADEESEEIRGAFLKAKRIPLDEEAMEFKARMMLYMDMVAAGAIAQTPENHAEELGEQMEENEDGIAFEQAEDVVEERFDDSEEALHEAYEDAEGDSERDESHDDSDAYEASGPRTHPLTAAGRFGTSPATIHLPKDTFLDPITAILAGASNKHLTEVARDRFGGPRLPNSTATPKNRAGLRQQPIALESSNFTMGEMEANAYLAAITPGIYAAVMSSLVEIRKRIGPEWIQKLLMKDGGPLILDAGGAGAGVLAWRDLLHAEWAFLNEGASSSAATPVGKSTVIVGSSTLRHRMSQLLENTTFLPRLPDYNPNVDHAALEGTNPQPRKQYDIIIAPHTLWTLKEDYMRKSQVQNFWSLLNPNGGVLLIVEKGVPRGFELVAGARETLLKHHIASPDSETVENNIDEPFQAQFRKKEAGMIIAPCTNHVKCPMYLTPGQSTGRKDLCHFSQRYIRPKFLQRILGAMDRNHEDILFSYLAVQRGIDQRETSKIAQGKEATDAAFIGYEKSSGKSGSSLDKHTDPSASSNFHTLSLPRSILPPIKRDGHVIVDLCTPQGQIERWTVPKSFSRQAYRDARKSQWGDLWALGAKTRTLRNIRIGTRKNDKNVKGKSFREAGKGDEEKLKGPNAKYEKRTKKGRKGKVLKRIRPGAD